MGRKHTWETALTPRETEEALCHGARPWSRLDQWTARNTWFARVRPGCASFGPAPSAAMFGRMSR